jgi:hypothetical protein
MDGTLKGSKALIHFSLQQEARFHDPVFIPIRAATVVGTQTEGDVYLVDFAVTNQVSLRPPPAATAQIPAPFNYAEPVRNYHEYLRSHNIDRPYTHWASVVDDFTTDADCPLDLASDSIILFQRTTEYLHQTNSYQSARFYFIQAIRAKDRTNLTMSDGIFHLDGGHSYDLMIFQYQPAQIPAVSTFQVSANPDVLRIGRQTFDIASEYASIPIPMSAITQPQNQTGTTDLTIDASPDVQGPRLQMPVEVGPPIVRRVAASTVASVALLLAGLPGAVGCLWKVLIVIAGGVVAWISLFFLGVGAPGGSSQGG